MLELLPPELPWLLVIAFLAGGIDAAVGGGGLIQLPGLFTALPQQHPALLLGSNKFTSMFGTATAAWRYARRITIPWRPVLLAATAAFVCSFGGASAVSLLPREAVRPLVLLLLIAILAYTLLKKDFGALQRPTVVGRRQLAIAVALGGAIGFYDGFFGPGTGSFLVFLFVRWLGYDFLNASASAKLLNTATNLAALILFSLKGHVWWHFAVVLAVSNVVGSVLGTRMAMKHGAGFVRVFFIGVVSLLILKTSYDAFLR